MQANRLVAARLAGTVVQQWCSYDAAVLLPVAATLCRVELSTARRGTTPPAEGSYREALHRVSCILVGRHEVGQRGPAIVARAAHAFGACRETGGSPQGGLNQKLEDAC